MRSGLRTILAVLAFAAGGVALDASRGANVAHATTFGPGTSLSVSFTTQANTDDLLWFFDSQILSTTGTPTISVSVFDGASLLGTYSGGAGPNRMNTAFKAATSLYNPQLPYHSGPTLIGPPAPAISFASLNAGTIDGHLTMSVTGGTVDIDTADLSFYMAKSSSSASFAIHFASLQRGAYTIETVAVPEPAAVALLAVALAGLGWGRRKREAGVGG